MKYFILVFLFLTAVYSAEEEAIKRVHSHLLIQDERSALIECESALKLYPESKSLQKIYIKTLAQNGKAVEALVFWKKSELGSELEDPDLIEALAWGILSYSRNSSQFVVNMASLMSAFFTDDVRAVKMLLEQLHSSNAILRAISAQLSPRYRDEVLIEKLQSLLKEEKNWFVRLEVIQALGAMEVKGSKEALKKILCHSRSTVEEKVAAMTALITIYEHVDTQEFSKLLKSKRAGLRQLACEIISHLDMKDKIPLIAKLLEDPHPDVRTSALKTLYFMGLKELNPVYLSKILDLTEDPHTSVALTASWVAIHFAPKTALKVIRDKIYSTDDAHRRLAAFILGRTGLGGDLLAQEVMRISPDPFVKANLALGMLGQKEDLTQAADILYTFLKLRKGKIMWDTFTQPFFPLVAPSTVYHIPQATQYPTVVDRLTRLDILGKLAVLKHPQAEEAVKSFLTHQTVGVTYAASIILLEEGGKEAVDILRNLLQEESENVRIQAALVLALSGGDNEAVEVLQEAYKKVDRDMKVNILGALGHIGDKQSIPFLIDLLEEPHQILKIVAASALIQCVYH